MTKKKPIKQVILFVGLMLVIVLIFGGRHFGIKGISDLLNPLRSSDKTRPEVLVAGIQPMVIWKKIQKMIEDGRIGPIVDRIYPMEQVAIAHSRVENEQRLGAVVIAIGDRAEDR